MEDEDTYGQIMARKGRTKVIYKGTFVSKQSLLSIAIRVVEISKKEGRLPKKVRSWAKKNFSD